MPPEFGMLQDFNDITVASNLQTLIYLYIQTIKQKFH